MSTTATARRKQAGAANPKSTREHVVSIRLDGDPFADMLDRSTVLYVLAIARYRRFPVKRRPHEIAVSGASTGHISVHCACYRVVFNQRAPAR